MARRRSFSFREDLYFAVKGYAEKLNQESVWKTTSAPKPFNGERYSHTEVANLILLGKLPPVPQSVFFEWEAFKNGTPSKTLGNVDVTKVSTPKQPGKNKRNKNYDSAAVGEERERETKDYFDLNPDFEKPDREKLSKGEPAVLERPKEKSTGFVGGGIQSF